MDWKTFSVRRFESSQLSKSGKPQIVATLTASDDGQVVTVERPGVKPQRAAMESLPWHSYDFDFASLNFALRHLTDLEKPLTFGIADVVWASEEPTFAYKGDVTMEFVASEERQGRACRKFSIDGPGLENRGGFIWIARDGAFIVDFEIDLPDEPGMKSGMLRLEKIDRMDSEGWQAFSRSKLR